MTSEVVSPPQPRRSSSHKRPPAVKKALSSLDSSNSFSSMLASPNTMSSVSGDGERTVKKLRMSKALTIPDGTMVADACRRMATRRVDAALLIASNAMLSGIVTDKDIATRVIAEELKPDETPLSKIMTKNPVFVTANTLAIDALQKMVQGKFRHLPVVEGGEVIALLDITKCLYDAISKMEKAAEQGSAIVAAVEGVERQLGNNFAQNMFAETFRERMFKPSLSTIITENKVATVSPSDSVLTAAKKMRDARVNSVIIMNNDKVQGILTSRDILTRVLAQNLPPEQTLMEKVMTPNPACTTVETTILEALHIMRGGKFLHLPVLDKEGMIVACVEVLQLIHAAMSMVESSSGAMNEMTGTMMHKFWDSALSLEQPDESEGQSEAAMMTSEGGTELGKHSSFGVSNPFSFKFEDPNGRVYRFNSGSENLDELVSCVVQRLGPSNGNNRPQLQYEDDEGDKVVLICDADLTGAVLHARSAGEKVLKLYVDYPKPDSKTSSEATTVMTPVGRSGSYFHPVILAGATVLTAIGVTVYLRHSNTGGAWKRW